MALENAWKSIQTAADEKKVVLGVDERNVMDQLCTQYDEASKNIEEVQQSMKSFREQVVAAKKQLNDTSDAMIAIIEQNRTKVGKEIENQRIEGAKQMMDILRVWTTKRKSLSERKAQFEKIALRNDIANDNKLKELQSLLTVNDNDDDKKEMNDGAAFITSVVLPQFDGNKFSNDVYSMFTRQQKEKRLTFVKDSIQFSDKYGRSKAHFNPNFGNNNNHYTTYTDRYASNTTSTERNIELEKELFGDGNTIQQRINFKNYDNIPVEVSGREVPTAIANFDESNLCSVLMNNIALCKYTTPTPIQKYSIPCVCQNRDLMACAQTGSGKTAAFLLPIIHNLYTTSNTMRQFKSSGGYNNREVYPSAVVLSPTRELAIQIHVQARKFLYRTGQRTCVVYGGADWRKQARDLRYGVDIIVATPGRLMDFMEKGFVKMSAVRYNVLDEADRMLDMGFMPQIKQIINEMPPKGKGAGMGGITRQTLVFSTMFPLEIQKLAQDFLDDYIFVAVGRVGSTNTFIDQKLKYVDEYDKTTKLIETVNQMKKTDDNQIPLTLIFVEKKKDAARVEKELIRSGYDAMSIHGDRSQREREHALKLFRMGKVPLLVATDVASRGLDIPNVMFVINYDLPNNIDAYVHRIGRTGRCGNNGNAISFVNETNKPVIKTLMSLLKESKSEIPQWFADLYYKYSAYNYSGYKNKYGNKYGGYNKNKFGARDYRHGHGRGGGGGGGGKRNVYNNYNGASNNNRGSYGNNNTDRG
eukprot:97787_1